MKEVFEAIKIIQEKHPKRKSTWDGQGNEKGKSIVGEIDCPKCGGTLHYSISGYNNHIHGHCETPNCLQWMM